jgi:hypothetical protein
MSLFLGVLRWKTALAGVETRFEWVRFVFFGFGILPAPWAVRSDFGARRQDR